MTTFEPDSKIANGTYWCPWCHRRVSVRMGLSRSSSCDVMAWVEEDGAHTCQPARPDHDADARWNMPPEVAARLRDALGVAVTKGIARDADHDAVNHPAHYTSHPSGVECIQITEHMGFNLGNALKYIWRADLKGDAVEDLRKAAWYVQREIDKRVQP